MNFFAFISYIYIYIFFVGLCFLTNSKVQVSRHGQHVGSFRIFSWLFFEQVKIWTQRRPNPPLIAGKISSSLGILISGVLKCYGSRTSLWSRAMCWSHFMADILGTQRLSCKTHAKKANSPSHQKTIFVLRHGWLDVFLFSTWRISRDTGRCQARRATKMWPSAIGSCGISPGFLAWALQPAKTLHSSHGLVEQIRMFLGCGQGP